ncbi:MAG: sugar phosphate isomerase/epimerase family protein [Dehalococcoidales bacterium]|nr:sugar phosphate isomerase/epimerase family protein [Dehalococcoidales bacterium]
MPSIVKAMKAAGLNCIELGDAPSVSEEDLVELNLLKSLISFEVHNYFPRASRPFLLNLASLDPDNLSRSLEFAKNAVGLCAQLGGTLYGIHSGFRADVALSSLGRALEYTRIADYEIAYQQMVKSLCILCDHALRTGVTIAVENHQAARCDLINGKNELLLGYEAGELVNLIKDVGRPNLGILLDAGHLNVAANTLGLDRMAWVEQAKPFIKAFHVHDNDGITDLHQPVNANSWIMKVLRNPVFSEARIVVEAKFGDIGSLAAHVAWLRRELLVH